MVIYPHKGLDFKTRQVRKVPGLGWAVTGETALPGPSFAVLAVKEHGKGFENREGARLALRELKAS